MKKVHIFSGHAQLPAGTDLYEMYRYATIVLKIDMQSGEVVDCMIPNYCSMHNDFVAAIIRGKVLDRDIAGIIEEIEETVHSLSTRALISALQVSFNKYAMCKNPETAHGFPPEQR
jgi:hypothetical protein